MKCEMDVMKVDYIVWLKSGRCVEGRAEESNVDYLIGRWRKRSWSLKTVFLTDDDGISFFRLSEIEAIAKNRPDEEKQCGFIRRDKP